MSSMGSEMYHRSDVISESESLKFLAVLHETLVRNELIGCN